MKKAGCLLAGVLSLVLAVAAIWFVSGWWGSAEIEEDTNFIVPSGASLTSVAEKLAKEGVIADPEGFLLRAKILGSSDPILAGEFLLPAGASSAAILDTFQHGEVIRRFVTIPEGLPSILVHERLMAEDHLTGEIPVPVEGSVLPDTYDFERGEARSAVLARMQAAMQNYLAEAWPKRAPDIAVDTIQDAVILASIVEKETGVARERRMVPTCSHAFPTGFLHISTTHGLLFQLRRAVRYSASAGSGSSASALSHAARASPCLSRPSRPRGPSCSSPR